MTLDELEIKCRSCRDCELCNGRTNLVFGVGKKDADIMLIGEGPGENEDLKGEPFVGRSGQLLDKFLAAVDLSREKNVYIANMVKCRPPQNRDPKPEEQEMCIRWLRQQFKIIKPKIVVCVGRIAAQRLIGKDFKVARQHGEFIEKKTARFLWAPTTRQPFCEIPTIKSLLFRTGSKSGIKSASLI